MPASGFKLKRILALAATLACMGSINLVTIVRAEAMTKSKIVVGEKAAAQTFGQNIGLAGLIVIGEYFVDGKIAVKQVLKGDRSLCGKTIELASPVMMGCRSQPVPSLKQVALLLRPGYPLMGEAHNRHNQTADNGVIEIYDLPDNLAMLRILVPIYVTGDEHERIKALRALVTNPFSKQSEFEEDPLPQFKKEFLFAICQMRDAANFDLVRELYLDKQLSEKDKLSLQDWIGQTTDQRAVPLLLEAIKSPQRFIASDAVSKLTAYYRSAQVDKALTAFYPGAAAELQPLIANYLKSRGISVAAAHAGELTTFQKAEAIDGQNKHKEALALYESILASPESNGYIIRAGALKVVKYGDRADREKLIKARLDWLKHDAANGNYLEVADTAQILRGLHDLRCLDALLAILPRRDFMFANANKVATMAIRDLGVGARQKAFAALRAELVSTNVNGDLDAQYRLLLELAWVLDESDFSKAAPLAQHNAARAGIWAQMQPLLKAMAMAGSSPSDEGASLLRLLDGSQKLPLLALDWVYFRLGDLHESRAVGPLVAEFKKEASYSPQTLKDALKNIAGETVVRAVEPIANDSTQPRQADAFELLVEIEKEKSLPLARRLLKDGNIKVDVKVRCLAALSRYGSRADRDMLLPLANYWTGDRALHYWIISAIAEIDGRCQQR